MISRIQSTSRAFTLIELIVVLAIIAVIVGVVLVAMGGVSSSVKRTESANALRQMLVGYDTYSTENNKTLMPGFVTAAEAVSLNIVAKREDGTLHTPEDSQAYIWRLAPHLAFNWQAYMIDYSNPRLNTLLTSEYDAGLYGPGTAPGLGQFGIAKLPAFGLNSIFLGGDSVHGGPNATDFHPWNTLGNESIAATRFSQVKIPASMIVFAPTQNANPAINPNPQFTEVIYGTPELRAPFLTLNTGTGLWENPQWTLQGDGASIAADGSADFAAGGGIPISRWGGSAFPVANLDGSTTIETYTSLSNDMRRWSHKATGQFMD